MKKRITLNRGDAKIGGVNWLSGSIPAFSRGNICCRARPKTVTHYLDMYFADRLATEGVYVVNNICEDAICLDR